MKLEDLIPGGEGDSKTLVDLAKKHGVDVKHMQAQLKIGLKVEKEHTNDQNKAKELSMDHLSENPNYYSKLKKANLADELDESKTGDYYIEIGETIEEIFNQTIRLEKLIKDQPNSTGQRMQTSSIEVAIANLKHMYRDVYDFEDK